MLTDSHCHLASHRFAAEEVARVIERAKEAGVTQMITLATCLEDVAENLRIASHPAVHACIGIHPCEVHAAPDDAVERLVPYLCDTRVCGIGETGLDYFHPAPEGWESDRFRERQREFLHQHFQIAASAGLNLVIHTRDKEGDDSFHDALAIYQTYHQSVRAVFHCFIGPYENAQHVFNLGGLVSFGGVATFKTAHQVRETIQKCPVGTFMIETDSPYLSPEPHRGKRNEPALMRHTATRIAELRGLALDELTKEMQMTTNAFFRRP
jgi:TatD DNase family protein